MRLWSKGALALLIASTAAADTADSSESAKPPIISFSKRCRYFQERVGECRPWMNTYPRYAECMTRARRLYGIETWRTARACRLLASGVGE